MQFIFKIGDKIKEAWPLYKAHFGTLLILAVGTFVTQSFISKFATQFIIQKNNSALMFSVLSGFLILVVSTFLYYLWIRLIFSIVDKKEINIFSKESLPTLIQFWNFIKTMILSSVIIINIGIIFYIIGIYLIRVGDVIAIYGYISLQLSSLFILFPGTYLIGRIVFAIFISVEKNQGGRASIKEAWEMTRGYGWKLFWKSLVIGLFMALGFIAFFIGSFVTYPIGFILMVMMYREFVKFKSQTPVSSTPLEVVKELPTEVVEEKVIQEEVK